MTNSVETTQVGSPQEMLQAARATKNMVDATANLLLLGQFQGNACVQIGNSYNFLKQFSEKLESEIAIMELSLSPNKADITAQVNAEVVK